MEQHAREATFGTRLKHRRMDCHLRQIDLAQLLGEPQGYVSRWESGNIEYMTLERLRKLAKHLHTTTDYLLGLSDVPEKKRARKSATAEALVEA